jgi:DNA invertase Pin-like site-specific DNA recombinase
MTTIYGYWRISCGTTQEEERQIRSLKDSGCEVLYGDKITGTSNYGDRQELSKLLEVIKEGDLLILSELSRLGRTMTTMLVEVEKLINRGVKIKTLDKRLDTTTMDKSIVKLIVGIMGYCSEQELSQIKSRCSEGRQVSMSRGVKFGRKRNYTEFQVKEVLERKSQGQGLGTIGKSLGMTRSMVQRIVKNELQSV